MECYLVDFEQAFDSVHIYSLWVIKGKYGIPDNLIQIVKALYYVIEDNKTTAPFPVMTGIKQSCCMSGFLFLLIIDWVMQQKVKKNDQEVDRFHHHA